MVTPITAASSRLAPSDHRPEDGFRDHVFNEDCISGMANRLPDASCDLVVTDPPFAIEFEAKRSNYNRTASRVLEGYSEVTSEDYAVFSRRWISQARRVLKPTGSIFIFSGWNNLKDILNAANEEGLVQVNHIIWKYQFGVATKRRFVTSHYHCLFYCLDDKQRYFHQNARYSGQERTREGGSVRYRDMEDVWAIKREYWTGEIKTPTKLPREIVSKILDYTSRPGDLVLDPFLGSGQVAVVSALKGRSYVGFEIVPQYSEFIEARLASGKYRPPGMRQAHEDRGERRSLF